ncbi:hypothetical protein [Myceligenerans indicum]|uniref:DUF8094 domain-containing protein n=1 Tax=Myceligenerans indicum TaxID=2593663 RepID=A0ABS1LHS9_9MICO|nr:hypothetical protein [Myceligenerans indicum]MBL0885786.1 hypothetical protein [Myceligenerans indicum]
MIGVPRAAAGAVAMLLCATVAGCAPGLPAPDPGAAAAGAAVTQEQEEKIIGRVAAAVEEATAGRKTAVLDDRVSGPAKALRTSQIEVAGNLDSDKQVTNLPMTMQAVLLPSEPGWPRTSLAVSTRQEDRAAPVLYAFEQRSPRSNNKLWAWVKLLRNETLPRFAPTETGAETVAPDDGETLVMSPREAVAAYADVLSEGSDSSSSGKVEDDEFRDLMREQESAQEKSDGWKDADGRYSFGATADEDSGVRAMRVLDGGAIVLGALDSSQLIKLQKCARIEKDSLTDTQRALLGEQQESNVLRTTYLDVVALYVPPAGSADRTRLVGVEHVAVDVDSAGDMSDCG